MASAIASVSGRVAIDARPVSTRVTSPMVQRSVAVCSKNGRSQSLVFRRQLLQPLRAVAPSSKPRAFHTQTTRCVLEAQPAASTSTSTSGQEKWADEVQGLPPLFMSDVVPKKKRNYWWDRSFEPTDIGYIVFMAAMHIGALSAPFCFSWGNLALFAGLYFVTGCLGITLSFHRQLSHRSFVTPKWLEYFFAYCGVQSLQGDPMEWVSSHRYHHAYCDTERDPHTPYEGLWWSHMGWLLDEKATLERVGKRTNISDMDKDPFYLFIQKTYIWHIAAAAALLFAFGGVPALVWGFCLRVVWVYHITWLVNSASHVWGTQEWNTGDLSRNNWWVAILAFGEGWHNNHHAFEYSARHGLEPYQVDMTWYVIAALEKVGLATKVKMPRPEHMRRLSWEAAPASANIAVPAPSPAAPAPPAPQSRD